MVGVGDGVMLEEGVKLGVAVTPSREFGLKLHALSKTRIHNPRRSFLKFISTLITGNGGDVNQKPQRVFNACWGF